MISLPLIDKFQALYFDEYIHLEQAKNGDFYLTHEIDDDTLREEIWIARNCLATEVPITIYMNSHGGGAYPALGLYDEIRSLNRPVTIIVSGLAASAAAMIVLQAATKRLSFPNSRFLLHEIRRWVFMGIERASDIKDEAKEMEALTEQITAIISKRTGKAIEEVRNFFERKEVWLSAKEALDWGLIDEIV